MTELPEGAIIVTPTDMYRQLQELAKDVHHITTLLDPSLANLHKEIAEAKSITKTLDIEMNKKVDDHEKRIRITERLIWKAAGATGLVSVLIGFAIAWMSKK